MSKYIDADKAIEALDRHCNVVCQYSKKQRAVMCGACPLGNAFDVLDDFPAADVAEVRHGRWLHLHLDPDDITGHTKGECSICGKLRIVDNYCPNCGARMDEVEE